MTEALKSYFAIYDARTRVPGTLTRTVSVCYTDEHTCIKNTNLK